MPGRAPAHAQLDQIATTLNNASHHLNVCTPNTIYGTQGSVLAG